MGWGAMRQLQLLWSLDNGHILITDSGLCIIYPCEVLSLLHSHSCTDQHCKRDSHHLVVFHCCARAAALYWDSGGVALVASRSAGGDLHCQYVDCHFFCWELSKMKNGAGALLLFVAVVTLGCMTMGAESRALSKGSKKDLSTILGWFSPWCSPPPAAPYYAPAPEDYIPPYSAPAPEEYSPPPSPVYSSPSPVYSSPSPVYSSPSPVYSSPSPVYSSPSPTYSPSPVYSSPSPVYSSPSPVYSSPSPVYSSPSPVYSSPSPVYSSPVYSSPSPVYSSPAPGGY